MFDHGYPEEGVNEDICPPPPNQLAQTLNKVFQSNSSEANSIIKSGVTTKSGLTSEEGVKWVNVLLSLSHGEREKVLDLPEEDLAAVLRSAVSKKKRRVEDPNQSPEHKRHRRQSTSSLSDVPDSPTPHGEDVDMDLGN